VEEAGVIRVGIAVACALVLGALLGWGYVRALKSAYDEGFAEANWAVIEKCRVQ
jgi:NhaP-type Na+/H+ or K+/H+ antiporter